MNFDFAKVFRREKKVTINGTPYKLSCRKYKDDGEHLPYEKTIIINSQLDDEHIERTFWHEYMHALVIRSGLGYTENWNYDMEEMFCESFSNSMTQLIKDIREKYDKD